jgi:hypothetical protein
MGSISRVFIELVWILLITKVKYPGLTGFSPGFYISRPDYFHLRVMKGETYEKL